MVSLWGALKSVIKPGDRVLAMGTGIFGYGIADMARKVGANVQILEFPLDRPFLASDMDKVRAAMDSFDPMLVTAVHCETPTGIVNDIKALGEVLSSYKALYYVDYVASACATTVDFSNWNIDLGLLGSQKVLGLPPNLGMVSISPKAWKVITEVEYYGFDALLPFKNALEKRYFPYTMDWAAIAGLNASLDLLLCEGLENVFARHDEVAEVCRNKLNEIGVELYAESHYANTVTACKVPSNWTWDELNSALRIQGVILGGSYGSLAGNVFRIGHMGVQADKELVIEALQVLKKVLAQKNQ